MKKETKEEIIVEDIPYGQIDTARKGLLDSLEGIYDPYCVEQWQFETYVTGQKLGEQIQSILNHHEIPKNKMPK